jgi:hypothetical protein
MTRGAWLVGVVALVVLGGISPPTARGAGASTVVVSGALSLSGPLNPVCTTGSPCPPSVILTPPPTGKRSPPYTVMGALRSVSFTPSACTGVGPAACTVAMSGSWHGYCDFASGRWSLGVKDGAGATHILDLTYELVGRSLVGRGHVKRSGTTEVGDVFVTATVTGGCAPGTTSLALTAAMAITYPKVTP